MNVLITGGTGFIGSRLALKCLERGEQVKIIGQANNPAEAENKALVEAKGGQVILASVTDQERLEKELPGTEIVYHLAAAQHEANVPDQRFWDVNVTGTKNVIESSIRAGVRRFVHGSTIGVYGASLQGNIDEGSPLRPDNIYGITKREAEKLVFSYQAQLPVVIIRISETFGPGDRRLLKLFKGIKKRIFFVIGNGQNLHHLIYVDDLIEGFFLASSVEKAVGKTLVLAGKDSLSTNEMAKTIAEVLGTSMSPFRFPLTPFLVIAAIMEGVLKPLGIQPPLHRRRMDFFKKSFVFKQELAREILGFVPQVSFKQGAANTAKWYAEMGYL